ncbi:hypothetical protein [Candidatus Chlorohelix sp.]|uniref:hypothetical protein n=1 Tax=Candidatus Chlorohelix sp. TaxID=3139201 RepID=UPI0030471017
MNPKNFDKNAITPTEARLDPKDGFTRTALKLTSGVAGSIDVLKPDGTPLCRLNISYFGEGRGGNVDVIPPSDLTITALAWDKGTGILRQQLPAGNLLAADLQPSVISDGGDNSKNTGNGGSK